MRSHIHAVVLPSELGEFADEVRRVFSELGGRFESLSGECSPPLDVHETDEALEVTVDLPGVSADAVRVVAKGNAVLIAGQKASPPRRGESSFHLVERGYGRFARTVRLSVPCDTSRARAVLSEGELRVTLPKTVERRGRSLPISVQASAP